MAIEAGQCEIAVVCFADNPKTGTAAGYSRSRGDDALYGWFAVLSNYAMIARRHMGELGTPREALGAVAVAARRHGAENVNAQLRKPLSLDEYMNLPPMVAPFCRDDCTLVSDGAAAVVVMSAERAKKMGVKKPVPILGFGHGQTSWEVPQRPDMTSTMAKVAGETAFKMAGLKPKDMDVAQLYDCFTITVLMTLEDYGFAKKGQIADFVKNGNIEIGGAAAGQHLRRTAVGDRDAGHAAHPRGRAADARRSHIASQGRKALHRLQSGRSDAHPRSTHFGPMNATAQTGCQAEGHPARSRDQRADEALLGCAQQGQADVPALPQVLQQLAAGARRVSEVPRGRLGLARGVGQGEADQLGGVPSRVSSGVRRPPALQRGGG